MPRFADLAKEDQCQGRLVIEDKSISPNRVAWAL